jgi:colanic acid/amylovoran biosynthesis glycosyltransferase
VIVAYLVNQYPRASHSFIRREIHALEAQGLTVHRFTIRPFTEVVDEADKAEEPKTHVLLDAPALFRSTVSTLFSRPGKFISALKLAMKVGKRSDRGMLINFVYLAEACSLLSLVRARNVEHLHAHFGTNSTTVAMLTRELGGPPYSFTCHGPEEFDRPESLALDEKVARSKFTVAISSFGRSQLFRWTRSEDWSRIHIVHCGLDDQFLKAPATPIPQEPRLVCVGRLAEQKGQLLLLQAAAQIAREGIDFKINFVGDGPLRNVIEQQIRELNLMSQIHITGWMTNAQVREEIEQSRALVLPSFAEGLPVVIMEALALHRPVISTYVAGIPELVEPNVSGWLVPAGSVEPLVDAMREALTAPVERLTELARAGAAKVALRHNASIEAKKLAALYSKNSIARYDSLRIP